uniref:DOMON domain-containing protein n=1 Tax=Anopheles minimus TaxID=112268 RepID=A0A182WEP3_9DIPT
MELLPSVFGDSDSDRHVKKHGNGEPLVDSSQDYVLLLGYENQTHTVLRFKRKLDTCDVAYDVPITSKTTY